MRPPDLGVVNNEAGVRLCCFDQCIDLEMLIQAVHTVTQQIPWAASLFWLAPNPLLDSLAALPIKVPFHSIIGNRGIDKGTNSTDGIVDYKSSHLEGAESEKIVPAGHNLIANPATVAEIKRILEENIAGRDRHRPK